MNNNYYDENVEKVSRRREKVEKEKQIRTLQIRKRLAVSISLATMSAMALVGLGSYKLGQKNQIEDKSISTEYQINPTCNIFTASPEILNAWADYAMDKFNEDAQKVGMPNSMYESYYVPVKNAYNNYIETKDERYKNDLDIKVKMFEKELITSKLGNYSFGTSPFRYAVVEDGDVLIPYTNNISNGIVPDESKIINFGDSSIVYVPYGSIEENNNSLGI